MTKDLELCQLLEEIEAALPSDMAAKVHLVRTELLRARTAYAVARKWQKHWIKAAEATRENEDFATARLCKACAQASGHIAEDLENDL